jgi:hypothetical protein
MENFINHLTFLSTTMGLESITGNILRFGELTPGTISHGDELETERRENIVLQDQLFHTADGAVYYVTPENIVMLAITREEGNPILANLERAYDQLLAERTQYYLSRRAVTVVCSTGSTEFFSLEELSLKKTRNDEWEYFVIPTDKQRNQRMSNEDRRFAERCKGKGDDFDQNMQMLAKAGIQETRVYVVSPTYVQNILTRKNKYAGFARTSSLNSYKLGSFLSLSGWGTDDHNLRGECAK